jgi:hypothetical protein
MGNASLSFAAGFFVIAIAIVPLFGSAAPDEQKVISHLKPGNTNSARTALDTANRDIEAAPSFQPPSLDKRQANNLAPSRLGMGLARSAGDVVLDSTVSVKIGLQQSATLICFCSSVAALMGTGTCS